MILIGFMGAGKTTIGRKLSQQLGVALIDLDEEIIEEIQMPIAEYFELYGEPAFRDLEHDQLKRLHTRDAIISTGGGCVETAENRRLLADLDNVIYLKADFETLWKRIESDKENVRPIAQSKTKVELEQLYQKRSDWYESSASHIIVTDDLTTDQAAIQLKQLYK